MNMTDLVIFIDNWSSKMSFRDQMQCDKDAVDSGLYRPVSTGKDLILYVINDNGLIVRVDGNGLQVFCSCFQIEVPC